MKSIGEFNERSLHRSLKERYAVVGSATEQAIKGFVVDAVNGGHIVEVQTGSVGNQQKWNTFVKERSGEMAVL